MNTITVAFDGRALIPDKPIDYPVGAKLEIIIVAPPTRKQPLADLIKRLEGLPADDGNPHDLSQQVDHYLYGTPKQENP